MEKLQDQFDAIGDKDKAGSANETTTLKESGAELALEDVEFDLLKVCWEDYRGSLPRVAAREINKVDDFMDGAKSISADEYLKSKVVKTKDPVEVAVSSA